MGARGLVLLVAVGAAGYAAHKARLLPPQISDMIDVAIGKASDAGLSDIFNPASWEQSDDERRAESTAIKAAMGGEVMPILGDDEVVEINKYEATLREHWSYVSPWARDNIGWAAAIMAVENVWIDPKRSGDNDTSFGIYQVKRATAETCQRAGYGAMPPTRETLETLPGGVYFGTSEMDRLSKIPGKGDNRDWVLAAYNGGAGWEHESASYQAARRAYVTKVKQKFVQMYGQGGLV